MFKLEDKIALVTGACGAIGKGIVHVLHEQGALVVATGTNSSKLHELQKNYSDRIHTVQADLSDLSQVDALAPRIEADIGRGVDILVNNAGITNDTLMMRMSDEAWNSVLNLNLYSPFHLMRACVKHMIKSRWGRIINISSVVGVAGNPGQANYCASKAGIIGLSKSLAKEIASRGITVNCVAPGMIKSPMVGKLPEEAQKKMLEHIPVGRIGTPEDVANCVAFLAASESSYITGHVMHVNGGMLMI